MVTEGRLAALLWLYGLLLGTLATVPLAGWVTGATASAPEYDVLRSRLQIGVLDQLTNYDLSSIWSLNVALLLTVCAVAVMGNAWVSAGMFGMLSAPDEPVAWSSRLGSVAGAWCWRFTRALLYTLGAGVAAFVAAGALFAPIARYVGEFGTANQQIALRAGQAACFLLIGVYLSLVLDYARVRMVLGDGPGPLRSVLYSLWFVLRHVRRIVATALVMASVLLGLVVAYGVIRSRVSAETWSAIAVTILLQQMFLFARSAWRVGTMASELAVYRAVRADVVPDTTAPENLVSQPEVPEPQPENGDRTDH